MKYHAPTNQFTVEPQKLKLASYALLNAIKNIRLQACRATTGYKNSGMMDYAEHAEAQIIDAALSLGIDLGSDRPGELDVSGA